MKFVRTTSLPPLSPPSSNQFCCMQFKTTLFPFLSRELRDEIYFPPTRAMLNQGDGDGMGGEKKSCLFFFSFFFFISQAQDDSIQLSRSNPGLIWHTTALSSAQRRTIRSKLIVGPPQPAFLICGCAHDSVSASQMLSPLVLIYYR